jgi:hypothetical protein
MISLIFLAPLSGFILNSIMAFRWGQPAGRSNIIACCKKHTIRPRPSGIVPFLAVHASGWWKEAAAGPC